ncbi:MAG: class I SAM-dependent methyltransferase, partial [Actinobacteria bacterium]
PVLDLGCGEGSTTARAATAAPTFGCDLSAELLRVAVRSMPVVRCRLPALSWVRTGSLGAAYSVFVLDLIVDGAAFFMEAARVVRPGGLLAVVINHPVYTAPGSGPFLDEDGDVMWRWGDYFPEGPSPTLAGGLPIAMQHRPIGDLLNWAAAAGWDLERLEERGLGPAAIAAEPGYIGQESIPRLLGARWVRRRPSS